VDVGERLEELLGPLGAVLSSRRLWLARPTYCDFFVVSFVERVPVLVLAVPHVIQRFHKSHVFFNAHLNHTP